tara:strand:+ start:291 stop:407 length:117 start_codon:yes stop_codon:yes gene_type:complete
VFPAPTNLIAGGPGQTPKKSGVVQVIIIASEKTIDTIV